MLHAVDSHDTREAGPLIAALVEAFPAYLWGRLHEIGIVGGTPVTAAVAESAASLATDLNEILDVPVAEQTRSPLEAVRHATQVVTAVLADLGVRAVDRDQWETDTHPEDRYGLYPGSSDELGEEAWQLHLSWGLAKAKAVAGVVPAGREAPQVPAVAVFGMPIEDRGQFADAIAKRGYRVLLWRNPAALERASIERPTLVLVDLRHPGAHEALRFLKQRGVRTVAVGDEVDDLTMPGILALGAEDVDALSGLAARLARLLPQIV